MANLPLLTLAAAAAQGYSNQQDANKRAALDATQQTFDNSIKKRTLDDAAAEAAAGNKIEQSRLDQSANIQRANLIQQEQAQIEARLKGMHHGDPGADPLIERHKQNDSELRSLLPGYSGGVGNAASPLSNAPSMGAQPPNTGADAAATPSQQGGGSPLDMWTMTPADEAAAAQTTAMNAADLQGKKDANATAEQKIKDAGSLDAFISAGTAYKDPTQNLQAQVEFNKSHGTDYPVTGGQYAVNPSRTGERLTDGTQGPQPQSYTQGPYSPSLDEATKRATESAALGKAQTENQFAKPIALGDIALKGAQTRDAIANATKTFAEAKNVPLDDWVDRYTKLASAGSKEDPALKQQQDRLADLTKAIQQAETNRTAAANGGQDTKAIDAYIANLQSTEYNVGLDVAARLSKSPSGTLQPMPVGPPGTATPGSLGTVPVLPPMTGQRSPSTRTLSGKPITGKSKGGIAYSFTP